MNKFIIKMLFYKFYVRKHIKSVLEKTRCE